MTTWVAQNDILRHPKTKLFISHGGANGQFEALYHGIPMISFPVFGDQPYNAKRAEYHGFAETLDVLTFDAEQLQHTIQNMLMDDSYSKHIQKASAIFKSRPMHPRDRTAFWIDHVLEFGGDHLHSHALAMPWYQYLMLDIFLFFICIVTVGGWIIVNISLLCIRRLQQIMGKSGSSSDTAQNNNDVKPLHSKENKTSVGHKCKDV